MYSSIKRIDIGGDTVKSMGTTSYYEGSVGWLLNPNLFNEWVDNVGIGFTINYGSSLKVAAWLSSSTKIKLFLTALVGVPSN